MAAVAADAGLRTSSNESVRRCHEACNCHLTGAVACALDDESRSAGLHAALLLCARTGSSGSAPNASAWDGKQRHRGRGGPGRARVLDFSALSREIEHSVDLAPRETRRS